MKHLTWIAAVALCCGVAAGQTSAGGEYGIALAEHKGKLSWNAEGFKIVQSSAKPNGHEIGLRGQSEGKETGFLGFFFLVPESAPMTSRKCQDMVLAPIAKEITVQSTAELARGNGIPVSVVSYTLKRKDAGMGYVARGFVASGDMCGDLEFYSSKPMSTEDAAMKKAFGSLALDVNYAPEFRDVVLYGQILYQTQLYKAAGPVMAKALEMIPANGAPFPSALIARRVLTDQAGMAYGMGGEVGKARTLFEKAIRDDPDYPLYYYNLACADAEEKKLNDAVLHLQQAFARKGNVLQGEKMPDPTRDDSFLPYKEKKDFWTAIEKLKAGR